MAFGISAATWAMVAAGTAAAGTLMQGASNTQAAEYKANVAQQNALIAQQQGEAAFQAQQRDAARQIGRMTAQYGASGVQTDGGSPLDVLANSAAMATFDGLTLKYNYALRAAGFENQSSLDTAEAKSATTSALLSAAATGIKGYGMSMGFGGSSVPGLGAGGAAPMDAGITASSFA